MRTGTLVHKILHASATKGPDDTNVFIASTGTLDRDNDRIDPKGWQLAAFKANPVVLYGHRSGELPIAKCISIGVVGDALKATIAWPPVGVFPFADTVHGMVTAGFVNAMSVGFRSAQSEPNAFGGRDHQQQELIEVSLVPIPSNTDAMVERGVDRVKYKSWLGTRWREQSKEDDMHSDCVFELLDDKDYCIEIVEKDRSPFEIMCDSMLANYSEMDSEKFRQLMAIQLALLGPGASIVDLVHALAQQGVAAPRSAPGFRHYTQGEQINRFNASALQYERDKDLAREARQHRPSFSMY